MKLASMSLESRLRKVSALLMGLPATVAAACFAHGHGALGSGSLLAILATCIAAGAFGSYLLLSLLRKPLERPAADLVASGSSSTI